MKNPESGPPAKTPMERLADFARKLIAVPKTEIDKMASEYDAKKRERKRRRGST